MKVGDVIEKPWGSEEILDLCAAYCVKRLRVRRGHRLSLQYHERKRETMMLLSGKAGLLVAGEGGRSSLPMERWEAHVVEPGVEHRVEGLSEEDAVILEVSTPELDDIVRVEDDYGRQTVV